MESIGKLFLIDLGQVSISRSTSGGLLLDYYDQNILHKTLEYGISLEGGSPARPNDHKLVILVLQVTQSQQSRSKGLRAQIHFDSQSVCGLGCKSIRGYYPLGPSRSAQAADSHLKVWRKKTQFLTHQVTCPAPDQTKSLVNLPPDHSAAPSAAPFLSPPRHFPILITA
ncbi:hypothetical protein M9H77_07368 [Catharanthus roseus]|uniref:Uncharacterized protein n=1 Tax=Catharanthus roseus TaxID=4058 RepID=A0ACC0BUR9_CATRO|nr:hypothetical protein M9H77_07368 [Catharanthus roseus]